ncbi:MAG: pseudouridine synthase [Lachnospiraceae bacterium]|nr:pseudouridine synthase [Lachnospiraceae bacterium]
MMREMRLNKYISASGFCSRRKADEWIASGSVLVNGKPADIGMQVKEGDTVTINGKEIRLDEPFKLVVFYKPKGYACTSHRGDKSGIFSNFNLDSDLRYVGRLDKDSEGLLLLTNDGNLCNDISRAANGHEKEYVVTVNRPVTAELIEGLSNGVRIFDANREKWVVTRPCKVSRLGEKTFSIILTQGYNRQIRRMCEHFDYRVRSLCRIRVMNIKIEEMKPGDIRQATQEEIVEIREMLAKNRL